MERQVEEIVNWIRTKVAEANGRGVIFGLSGGIDSAVVAALAKKAFPDNSLGLIMPCHSNPKDEEDALVVSESVGLKTQKVDLTSSYDLLLKEANLEEPSQLAMANIKPRLRMTTLYLIGQQLGYLVLGPTNRSEFHVGYFTKHGDSSVDLMPIADFVKMDIFAMAKILNIPESIINKKPSAGLWEEQTDEEELGFSYEELDRYILTGQGSQELKDKVDRMHRNSQHKRNYAQIYRIK